MPLFGSGGTTHADLSNGKTKLSQPPASIPVNTGNKNTIVRSDSEVISPYGPLAGTSGLLNLNSSDPADVNVMRYLYSLGIAETGFVPDPPGGRGAISDNQISNNSNVRNAYNDAIKRGLSESEANAYAVSVGADYGFYRTNGTDNTEFIKLQKLNGYSGTVNLGQGSIAEQTQAVDLYIKLLNPTAYQAMQRGDYTTANKLLNGRWPSLPGGKTYESAQTSSGHRNEILNAQTDTTNSYQTKLLNTTPTLNQPPPLANNTEAAPVLKHLDSTVPQRGMDARTPNGINSAPEPGTFVWVFFLGGDVQKPVYFAGVTEKNAGARNTLNPNQIPYKPPTAVTLSPSNAAEEQLIGLGGEFGTKLASTALDLLAAGEGVGAGKQYLRKKEQYCWAGVKTALQPLLGTYLGGATANDEIGRAHV